MKQQFTVKRDLRYLSLEYLATITTVVDRYLQKYIICNLKLISVHLYSIFVNDETYSRCVHSNSLV